MCSVLCIYQKSHALGAFDTMHAMHAMPAMHKLRARNVGWPFRSGFGAFAVGNSTALSWKQSLNCTER